MTLPYDELLSVETVEAPGEAAAVLLEEEPTDLRVFVDGGLHRTWARREDERTVEIGDLDRGQEVTVLYTTTAGKRGLPHVGSEVPPPDSRQFNEAQVEPDTYYQYRRAQVAAERNLREELALDLVIILVAAAAAKRAVDEFL